MTALVEQARHALSSLPSRQAVEYQGRWFCWSDLSAVADSVTRILAEDGLSHGASIAFVPRNRPSAIAAELAMIAGAHTIRMAYAFQASTGIARDVGRLPVQAVVAANEDFTPELIALVKERGLTAIGLEDMHATRVAGTTHGSVEVSTHNAEPQIFVHTSGTTGAPKSVGFRDRKSVV